MHESGLIEDLISKVESVARENAGRKVVAIEVSIGPLAAVEPEHLREHFEIASVGTLAEGAELRVRVSKDLSGENSAGVLLESVEIETE